MGENKNEKIVSVLLFTVLFSATLFAGRPIRKEPSPLSVLSSESERKSWCEREGYAFVAGYGNLHYWLYDSYKYHDGDVSELLEKIVFKWFRNGLGYFVVEKPIVYEPNTGLADSVKNLMKEYDCDVSVTFLLPEKDGGFASVIMNSYDRDTGIYATYVYRGTKVDR